MNRIIFIFFILIVLYFLMFDNFADTKVPCSSIEAGECTSKLCPEGCRIQKKDDKTCHCIDKT